MAEKFTSFGRIKIWRFGNCHLTQTDAGVMDKPYTRSDWYEAEPRGVPHTMRNRTTVNVIDNVSGVLQACLEECYEQARSTGVIQWVQLAEQVRSLYETAVKLGGEPKPPVPRGRSVAIARRRSSGVPGSSPPQSEVKSQQQAIPPIPEVRLPQGLTRRRKVS